MFGKMKTGTKVLVGFGCAVAALVIVGFVGYRGINKLSGHVEEVGVVRLPSVKSLLEVQVGAEQIKTFQRALLDAGLDFTTRQRLPENLKDAAQRCEAAWKVYEILPQTPEEAQVAKQFVRAWQDCQSNDNEFFRLSQEVDQLIRKCPGATSGKFNLPNALQEAENQCWLVTHRFKDQVQEWKDILLRGNNAADYDKYVDAFQKAEQDVQAGLGRLRTLMTDAGVDPQLVADVTKAHAELGAKYHDALNDFNKSNPEAGKIADRKVRGLDRHVTAMFNALAAAINERAANYQNLASKMAAHWTSGCRTSQNRATDLLDKLIKINEEVAQHAADVAQADSSFAGWGMLTAMGIGAAALLALGVFVTANISMMLTALVAETERLSSDAVAGKLQTRGNPALVSDEFRPILEGFNATLDAVVGPLNGRGEVYGPHLEGRHPGEDHRQLQRRFQRNQEQSQSVHRRDQRPGRREFRPWRRRQPTAISTSRPTRRSSRASSATSFTA